MPTNEYKQVASDPSANVSTLEKMSEIAGTTGYAYGSVLESDVLNRVLRQATMASAALADLVMLIGLDALDDGDASAFSGNIQRVIKEKLIPDTVPMSQDVVSGVVPVRHDGGNLSAPASVSLDEDVYIGAKQMRAFTNSSISAMAANPVYYNAAGDDFPTRASIESATVFYRGGAEYVPSQNDYATVVADEGAPGNFAGGQTRWKFDNGKFEYDFAVGMTLTAKQLDALNSEVTYDVVQKVLSGNTDTATALKTPRAISTDATSTTTSRTFDGTAPVSIGVATTLTDSAPSPTLPVAGSIAALTTILNQTRSCLAYLVDSAASVDQIATDAAKARYTDAEKTKLAGVEDGANKYTLPAATSTVVGGVTLSAISDAATNAASARYTDSEKTKLSGIATGATASQPANELPQDPGTASAGASSYYARGDHRHNAQVVPAPATVAPVAPGSAAVGTSDQYARQDHRHPSQTVPAAATATPKAPGTAAVGTSAAYAREDHIHQAQTVPSPSNATPLAPGTATPGTSAAYAREGHVHPGQTAVTGNAATATKLQTARTITANAAATTAGTFDGSANISVGVPITTAAGTSAETLPPVATSALQGWLITARNCLAWLVDKVKTIPAKGTVTPSAPGTAAVGSTNTWADAGHIHPAQTIPTPPSPATATPLAPGTAAVGTSAAYAREDHRHQSQTVPAAATTIPIKDGAAAIGTSSAYARADHVHQQQPAIWGP